MNRGFHNKQKQFIPFSFCQVQLFVLWLYFHYFGFLHFFLAALGLTTDLAAVFFDCTLFFDPFGLPLPMFPSTF